MYSRSCRLLFCLVVAAIAASQSGCGASSSDGARAASAAPATVEPPPSPPPSQQHLPDNKVLEPDEQTLRHVRAALAQELPQFNTAQTIDGRRFGLHGDGIADETA